MSTIDWDVVKRLLAEALAQPPEDREPFLRRACGADERIRAEVLALLGHHERAGSFLEPPAQGVPTELCDVLLADRYRLGRLCGLGGFGAVYEAEDLLARRRVAVKVLRGADDAMVPAMRREVATLRWLRLPGVVQLFDDGVADGHAFVVMEYVEGSPFPGQAAKDWPAIREVSTALVETLARIHWAGVIHCDLKPNNVLVRPDGVPVVLDLGISAGPAVGEIAGFELAGTPRYAAPERFAGGGPTERWDIYSVGVMFREALAGTAHDGGLAPAVAGLPASVTDLIYRMTAEDPADRPVSAAEVLDALRGDEPDFVWLGSTTPVDALVEAGRTGRSLDVCGPAGSGRSRCLREAAQKLRRDGREVLFAIPDERPLASLASILGEPTADNLDAAQQATRQELRHVLESGTILAVDDSDAIDPFSATVIADCRNAGSVLRALAHAEPGALELKALDEEEIKDLFVGPDRLVHLREDAARELFRRSAGRPADMAREIAAWVRAGLARREGSRFVVTRAALEQLRLGLGFAAPPPVTAEAQDERDLVLACVDIAHEHTTPALVAKATGLAPWVADAYLVALGREGAILRRPSGGYESLASPRAGVWSRENLGGLHSLVADCMAPGTPERLLHLLAARRLDDVVAETPAVAQVLLVSGRVWAAESVLLEGLRALHASEDPCRDETLLPLLLRCALAEGTSASLDLVLYYCGRSRTSSAVLLEVEAVARAAQLVNQGDASRALDLLKGDSFEGSPLKHERHSVRVLAASESDPVTHERVVNDAVAWADAQTNPTANALSAEWRGWLRYRQGRYADAARCHEEAAARTEETHRRIAALLSASWAWLEDFDLARCADLAARARALAAACRHAHYEARAWALLRCAAYRGGTHGPADRELVEAIEALGIEHVHGVALLNEAAVAWRTGQPALGRVLASRAAQRFEASGEAFGAVLSRCLALACGGSDDPLELEAAVRKCPAPGLALQAMGLLAHAGHGLSAGACEAARRCAEQLKDTEALRREVISPREALAFMQSRPTIPNHME